MLISCEGDVGLQSLFHRSSNLEFLELQNVTLPDDFQNSNLLKLATTELVNCKCTAGLQSLLCRATNLKVLRLFDMNLDADTARIVGSNQQLKVLRY